MGLFVGCLRGIVTSAGIVMHGVFRMHAGHLLLAGKGEWSGGTNVKTKRTQSKNRRFREDSNEKTTTMTPGSDNRFWFLLFRLQETYFEVYTSSSTDIGTPVDYINT